MGLTFLLGLALGLFWGERGRRLAAERWKVYGTPEAPQTASVSSPSGNGDSVVTSISDEAVERGARELEAMMSTEGFTYSKAEYAAMARSMLAEAGRR